MASRARRFTAPANQTLHVTLNSDVKVTLPSPGIAVNLNNFGSVNSPVLLSANGAKPDIRSGLSPDRVANVVHLGAVVPARRDLRHPDPKRRLHLLAIEVAGRGVVPAVDAEVTVGRVASVRG